LANTYLALNTPVNSCVFWGGVVDCGVAPMHERRKQMLSLRNRVAVNNEY
jgi:hypothetical protein